MKREIKTTLALDGEKEFKKGLEEAQRQMRVLSSESKAVTSAFGANQKSVEALTAKNRVLTQQIDQQEEIVKALKRAVEESAKMYGEADAKTDAWRIKLNNAEAALNKMQNELDENERALKEMASAEDKAGDEAKQMEKDIKGASNETKGFKAQIEDFASSSIGQFASIAGAIALAKEAFQKLGEIIDEATNWADDILTLSAQTGVAVDTLQEMQYAARFVDVEVETLTKTMARNIKSMKAAQDGTLLAVDAYERLGVEVLNADGSLRDSQTVYWEAIDALGRMGNETERDAIAMQLFGRSAQELNPLIKAGGDSIQAYGKEAKEAGRIIDNITVMALGKLDDRLEQVAATAEAMSKKTAGYLIEFTDAAASAWEDVKKAIDPFQSGIEKAVFWNSVLTGRTQEAVRAQLELQTAERNVAYITGLTTEQVKAQADALSQYLMVQDATKSSTDAYNEALVYVAQGMDAVAIAQQRMADEQAAWDEQVNAALDNYIEKRAAYEAAVKQAADSYISDLGGLFNKFDAGLAKNQKELDKMTKSLLDNLRSQVKGIEGWSEEMEKLSKRGIDDGLLKELRDMGPEAYAQIQALNNMTDEELREYESLYKTRSEAARNAAKEGLKPMEQDVKDALKAAEKAISDRNSAMKSLGANLSRGLGDGIKSNVSYVEQKAREVINAAIAAARKAGRIQSPSKLMRDEVGKFLGEGVGVGFVDSIKAFTPKIEDAMRSMAYKLSDSVSWSASAKVTTKEIIRDRGFQPQFNGPIYINNGMDIQKLAEELAYYYRRARAAQGA